MRIFYAFLFLNPAKSNSAEVLIIDEVGILQSLAIDI